MKENYSYPLDFQWSQAEIIQVMAMWQQVEAVYEQGVERQKFLQVYQDFKKVVPQIGEERRLGREFEEISGYSLYQAVKLARSTDKKIVKIKER